MCLSGRGSGGRGCSVGADEGAVGVEGGYIFAHAHHFIQVSKIMYLSCVFVDDSVYGILVKRRGGTVGIGSSSVGVVVGGVSG